MSTRESQPQRAIRLIFEYDGASVRLLSQHPVEMVIPDPGVTVALPGYYVDLRDAAGATVARVAAPDAFNRSLEVFPEGPGEPITRIDLPVARGAFTVVIPASDAADRVTVVQVVPPDAPPVAPAGEREAGPVTPRVVDLVSFPLQRQ